MFIGHFAVGMAAKSVKPSLSLGTYFIAVQFVDLLWPTLLLFNLEQVAIEPGITAMTPLNFIHYPISHSLVMAAVWAFAGFALVYFLKKDFKAAILIAACVASHWLLDFFTHRPDLPITLSETTKVGLGLWNYKMATFLIESVLFAVGVAMYLKKTQAKDNTGKYAFWGLIIFLAFISVSNMVGPPPPNVAAIAWAGHLQWLFVLWAYWVDKHRSAV
ncbi:MAG TPA: hypothetical protein DGG95_00245 [Cytophagales bacterium]|jgi:hypothetical protein|nr:hypothetical protein [Cytophagales bacterium]